MVKTSSGVALKSIQRRKPQRVPNHHHNISIFVFFFVFFFIGTFKNNKS